MTSYDQHIQNTAHLTPYLSQTENIFIVSSNGGQSKSHPEIHVLQYDDINEDIYCQNMINMSQFGQEIQQARSVEDELDKVWVLMDKKIKVLSGMDQVVTVQEDSPELQLIEEFKGENISEFSIVDKQVICNVGNDRIERWNSGNVQEIYKSKRGISHLATSMDTPNLISCVTKSTDIVYLDDRKKKAQTIIIPAAHNIRVSALDFHQSQPNLVVSGGFDNLIKVWDIRKPNEPTLTISGHSHWPTQLRFNPEHDHILASASTDATVCLWSLQSLMGQGEDCQLEANTDNDSSILHLCWSFCSPWFYCSVSRNGTVLVHQVPNEEKKRIVPELNSDSD